VTTTSITQAKVNLSKSIGKIRHGDSVLILDRNIPLARLQPLAAGRLERDEAELAEPKRRDLLKSGAGKLPRDFLKLGRFKSLLEAVLEARRETRW
jgi:antitoxin (DNA-binding transcriptional repressor) of toxin-antitoxin stability system